MSNYAIWGVFGPATWPLWLALLAFVASFSSRLRRVSRLLLGLAVGSFVAFGLLPSGDWLSRPLELRFPRLDTRVLAPAHIVVLAGAEELDASVVAERPEFSGAADRVVEGAALAREHPRATLWIVGGVERHGRADVEWTRLAWARLGVDPARIKVIGDTHDTCENAIGVARRRLPGEIVLVTSAIHMPRAVACFAAHDVAVTPYPVDYTIRFRSRLLGGSILGNLRQLDTALHEWIGLAWYRLRGRTGA